MTEWLKLVVERLSAVCVPAPPLAFRKGPPPALVIAEVHPAVGELSVEDDGDELTVCVGRVYHQHFFPMVTEPREGLGMTEAIARDVAEFVAAVLADRIFFAVHYDGDRVVSFESGVVGEDEPSYPIQPAGEPMPAGETRSRAYLWSGPVDRLPEPEPRGDELS
ncbi:MAG TPA: hypothetical protein VGN57_19880 [Pirellulaceae bacterium]|jgi:hypothetical protein|nr:hypothetical protein [Pirellulaceae bacterium]